MITSQVLALRDQFNLPGMRVIQFAFGDDNNDNIHRPHTYPPNCVAYTGTHDNDTTLGWFRGTDGGATTLSQEQREWERRRAMQYLCTDGREINWDCIRAVFQSAANTAIVPLQDVLGLGSEARMNVPGKVGGNWSWRFTADMLTDAARQRLHELTGCYGR
jgi:4-alpha-glucanotransferase